MKVAPLGAGVRAAAPESAVLRAIARLFEAFRAARPSVDSADWMHETEWLRSVIAGSRIGRAALAIAGAVGRAWSAAALRSFVEAPASAWRRLSVVERVRAVGIWAATAAVTVALLTLLDPRPASRVRWALWAGFFALGAIAAVWPGPAIEAWTERLRIRLPRPKESE